MSTATASVNEPASGAADQTKNHPVADARLGVVSAAAWLNRDAEGNRRGLNVSLTKRYFDGQEWKNSRCYLAPHEVGAALAVLSEVQRQLLNLDAAAFALSEPE